MDGNAAARSVLPAMLPADAQPGDRQVDSGSDNHGSDDGFQLDDREVWDDPESGVEDVEWLAEAGAETPWTSSPCGS